MRIKEVEPPLFLARSEVGRGVGPIPLPGIPFFLPVYRLHFYLLFRDFGSFQVSFNWPWISYWDPELFRFQESKGVLKDDFLEVLGGPILKECVCVFDFFFYRNTRLFLEGLLCVPPVYMYIKIQFCDLTCSLKKKRSCD